MPDLDRMFGIDVYAAYGMTELVSHAITGKPSELLPTRSMGHVAPGYELAVVDKDTGELCAEGQTGELWMRGTRGIEIFLEYFDNPEANAASFEDGWFKTGDMVQMGAGGNVFYQERDKDLIKVGGENVSAREVEEVVDGRARGGPGCRRGEEARVARPGRRGLRDHDSRRARPATSSRRQVIEACTASLAEFKVPRAVYVVEEFPSGHTRQAPEEQAA